MESNCLFRSFKQALEGIFTAIRSARNMKIHVCCAVLVFIFGIFFKIQPWEWLICIIWITLVLAGEMLNTAIEAIVDLTELNRIKGEIRSAVKELGYLGLEEAEIKEVVDDCLLFLCCDAFFVADINDCSKLFFCDALAFCIRIDAADSENHERNVIYYEDNLVALTDLEVGGVDAVVMDSVVADYNIKTGNKPLVLVDEVLAKESYGIGFRKDEAGAKLRDDVWAALKAMEADGTVEAISNKWFGSNKSVIGK
ncbi:MAG: diacylglycerol kinase, partial [Treponemataceae bacterium]|nr:diacylglycerol kinase [Treponemataceae bacterium]